MITLIAAVGKNNELGKNNGLIWNLPNDLKFFREKTLNKTVVMGRKTFDSIGRPLPKRKNIVISRNKNLFIENVEVYYSVEDVLNKFKDEEIIIIGGENIYKQLIDIADKIYLTEVDARDNSADSYFPSFDKTKFKKTVISSNSDNGINYTHVLYKKKCR